MPFTNPYMQGIDLAGGTQDIMSTLLQIMMMNRMFPQTKTTETPDMGPQGMPPPMSGIPPKPGMGQEILGGAPTSMPPTGGPPMPGGSPMPQMDPQMMQMLMQMLMQRQQQQPPTPQFGM